MTPEEIAKIYEAIQKLDERLDVLEHRAIRQPSGFWTSANMRVAIYGCVIGFLVYMGWNANDLVGAVKGVAEAIKDVADSVGL